MTCFLNMPDRRQWLLPGRSIDELLKEGTIVEEIPQPLLDIHLHSDALVELEANGDIRYVYIFSVVAVFILLLAIVNFINLATARSADRAREVGLRKVLGSQRKLLIFQFLTESVLMSIAAVIVGVVLANLLMPFFNSLSGKALFVPNGSILFLADHPTGWNCHWNTGRHLSGYDHVGLQAHDHPFR